jgi:hypothetical protein
MGDHSIRGFRREQPSIIVPNHTRGPGICLGECVRNKANFPALTGRGEGRQSPKCCRR